MTARGCAGTSRAPAAAARLGRRGRKIASRSCWKPTLASAAPCHRPRSRPPRPPPAAMPESPRFRPQDCRRRPCRGTAFPRRRAWPDQHRQRQNHAAFDPGLVLWPEVGHDLLDRAQGRFALRLFDGGIVTGLRVVGSGRDGSGRPRADCGFVVSAGMGLSGCPCPYLCGGAGHYQCDARPRAPTPRRRAAGRAVGRSGPERSGRGRGCSRFS
jgi:hypothetical protein